MKYKKKITKLCLSLALIIFLLSSAGCRADKDAISIPALAQQMLKPKEEILDQLGLQEDDYTTEYLDTAYQEEKLTLKDTYSFAGSEFEVSLYILPEANGPFPDYKGCLYSFDLILQIPHSEATDEQFAEITEQTSKELVELLPGIGTLETKVVRPDAWVIRMADDRRIDVALEASPDLVKDYYTLKIKFNGTTELINR